MKVKGEIAGSSYKPISITMTFNTEDELIAFHLLMNHSATAYAKGVKGIIDVVDITNELNRVNLQAGNRSISTAKWDEFNESVNNYLHK